MDTIIELGKLRSLALSWLVHLEAENKSSKTLISYRAAAEQLEEFLRISGMPTDVSAIAREHIDMFLIAVMERTSASTAATRYRALQQLFKWLRDEGEIDRNPMERMRPPKVDERPVPVISDDDLRALFKVCSGPSFDDRRDMAMFRLLLNTGARIQEMSLMKLGDVDLHARGVYVMGKGRKARKLNLGPKATKAVDRYLRIRARHSQADEPWLWIGLRGRLTDDGMRQRLETRCKQAGIKRLHPHQFRHTFSHQWLADGGTEYGLAEVNGWVSTQMVGRYAKSTAAERARREHSRLSPGDHL
jgi:site-specific recombinase XerD